MANWTRNCADTIVCTDWEWPSGKCIKTGVETNVPSLKGLECAFSNTLNVVAEFVLLVAFIVLLIGGFKYLTSGGDSKATEAAQHTITYAIFGLVALVIIWLFLKLIETITGVPVTIFQIP